MPHIDGEGLKSTNEFDMYMYFIRDYINGSTHIYDEPYRFIPTVTRFKLYFQTI
jgi:hypothetical protein